jgi:hypothetical protein
MAQKLAEKYKDKIYIGLYHFTLKLSRLGCTSNANVRESLVYLQTPHTLESITRVQITQITR